uniref:PHD-type domain-containing protein n=1 Tax=Anopheles atroparvus TaxID=41427 RepID=A0AAG5D6N8_ANOAO
MPKLNFDCVACQRDNSVADMVQCEVCDKWWHFDCAGVTADVEKVRWICVKCTSAARSSEKARERSGRDQGEAQSEADRKSSQAAKLLQGESSGARRKEIPALKPASAGKASLCASEAVTLASWFEKQGLALCVDKTTAAATSKEMASAKEIKAFGVSDQHSSPSVKSGSSRATKASKLEQLEREQALQMELLHAEMTAKMAKLKLSQAKQLNQLAEELVSHDESSSSSGTTKVLEWLQRKNTRKSFDASVRVTEEAKWRPQGTAKESSTRQREPLRAEEMAARKVWPAKLPPFSGSPKEWPIFYSCYNESTKACGFSSVENIMRLEGALTGAAR